MRKIAIHDDPSKTKKNGTDESGSEETQAKNDIMLPKPWLKKLGGGLPILVLGLMIGYRAPDDIERTRVHINRGFAAGCAKALGVKNRAIRQAIVVLREEKAFRKDPEGFCAFQKIGGGDVDPDEWRCDALYLPRGIAMVGGSREGGLTAEGKCIWAAIWMISKRKRWQCDARVDTIAEEAGVSERATQYWLPRFRQLGGIAYADRKRLNKDTYVIRFEDIKPDISDWIVENANGITCTPEAAQVAPQKSQSGITCTPKAAYLAPEETSVRDVREERDVVKETALRPASLRSVSAEVPETEPNPVSGISEVSGFQRLRPVPTFPYMSGTGVDEKKAPGSLVDASSSRKVAEASRLPESLSRGEPDASLMEGHWFSAPTPKPLSQERKYQKAQELLTAA